MSGVRLRWRADATGYVARYAGQWAGREVYTRQQADDIVRAMPNGDQVEIVEAP